MNSLLLNIIKATPGLLAIIISDKDGVPIAKALAPNQRDHNLAATYVAPFPSACEQSSKLGLGKTKSIACFYDKYQVVSMCKGNIHYHFFGTPNGNTGHFLTLDSKLDLRLDELNEMYNAMRNLQD